ncbi:MAG: aminopeptidase P family N-terminal domain-containing protein [Pigmentiphaga sp.]|uniref:aminopeptidase P family N-terminal domain-containing protein n=1 Tax=Pigmentiphaga sp. TaxID=1977564 RepID=UPI0029BC072F|nr:aminopeptidase P family N-terminal domain-containing protein [Pigmentiphaga sp.]MDX3904467.1 aminopeptidase P family N-terminal domain-containing protein [Pigmentiphaga sp.]
MSWSQEELPASVLDERVARLQAAMEQEGWGAVLAYTSFAEPAAVHWLTNFTPYWSEAMLLVLPRGKPVLLAALTPRVHGWIREVSHLGDLVSAPRLASSVLQMLADKGVATGTRIGVIGLDALPASVAMPLLAQWGEAAVADATRVYASLRQPCGVAELALARRAWEIAVRALAAAPGMARSTSQIASAVEASARADGAEEVLHRMAPDLARGAALMRLEGGRPLGQAYALELSVAYKGYWVRAGRSFSHGPRPQAWEGAQAWFRDSLLRLAERGADAVDAVPASGGRWTLEACIGAQPLSLVRTQDEVLWPLPAGSLAIFSAHLATEDGHWFQSAPVVLGGGEQPGQVLEA